MIRVAPRCDPHHRFHWSASAVVHTHVMAAWWSTIHGTRHRRGPIRVVGNVIHLPAPIAGYRIRHDGVAAIVEIKPSRAPAIVVGRCMDAEAARALLALVSAEHGRPFLGEIGRAAA